MARDTRSILLEALESWRIIDEARRKKNRLEQGATAAVRGRLNSSIIASKQRLRELESELRSSLEASSWLSDPIESLGLESRITNALRRANIYTIQELVERDLRTIPYLGSTSVMQIGIAMIRRASEEGA